MKQTELFFDSLFETIGNIIISFIRRVAPFAVPAAPAWFFGHAVSTAVSSPIAAPIVGFVAALGLESAGILAAHHAVKFYTADQRGRGNVAAASAIVYLAIGIFAIWFLDGATQDAKATGTAMFLISGIVYLLIGMEVDTRAREQAAQHEQETAAQILRDETAQKQAEESKQAQWERDQKAADLELQRELKRKELEANQALKLAKFQQKQAAPAPIVQATNGTIAKTDNGHLRADWRTLSTDERQKIATLSPVQIVELYNVDRKTADRWLKRTGQLNGHLR